MASGKMLLLVMSLLAYQAVAVPKWQQSPGWSTPASYWSSFNITKMCSNNGTVALMSSTPKNITGSNTLKWIRPLCAIGGSEVRVDTFLFQKSIGQLGLGQYDCSSPDLIHDLNFTWTAFWYILHPGVYTVCSRPTPTAPWKNETQIYLLDASNETCSYIMNPNSTTTCTAANGTTIQYKKQVQCDMTNATRTMQFFDGFLNNNTAVPKARCATSCSACTSAGGSCFGWEWSQSAPTRQAVSAGSVATQPTPIRRTGWRIPCK